MTMLTKFNDQEIIAGLRNRDREVFNHIYDSYSGLIRAVLLRTGASADLVDDIFQDTVIAVMNYVGKPDFKLRRKFKSLFCSMARFTYLKKYRSRKIEVSMDVVPEGTYDHMALQEIISEEKRQREEKLDKIRKRLSADDYELLQLKFSQNMKYEEIALLRDPALKGPPLREADLNKAISRLKAKIHDIKHRKVLKKKKK